MYRSVKRFTVHYLIKESLWELLETLGTHKAVLVVQLSIAVDDLLGRSKATLAALTGGTGQGIGDAVARDKEIYIMAHDFPQSPCEMLGWPLECKNTSTTSDCFSSCLCMCISLGTH